ncbi:excisionase family DNA-binding protein [Knoellia sinensis]|nr:excisionase family DNA-binding protein [Knoellia sinensis]
MERIYTLDEAAKVMGTTTSFPRRLVAQRRIRFVEDGLLVCIPESAIDEFLDERSESERRQT